MTKYKVRIENREETVIFGLWKKTSDKTIAKDINGLSAEYHRLTNSREGSVLPFYVLSRNYNEKSGESELFIGSERADASLESLTLPKREYAFITVKPAFGFFWGAAVGRAKRYFYREWLPKSGLTSLNMEYEYHSESTVGKDPTVDIVFAVCRSEQ